MTTPQIIAHRGASYLAPENTLVAFRKAMEIGADGVEMDVQKTYDNELVIHHDYMVDMHTDISGQIYDLTMGELKALDFGSWKDAIYANERIATLHTDRKSLTTLMNWMKITEDLLLEEISSSGIKCWQRQHIMQVLLQMRNLQFFKMPDIWDYTVD